MVDELGATGVALGLTTSSAQITNAVYSVERLLGVAIASVPAADMAKLEAAARWEAWKASEAAATGQYDLGADGSTLKRSQFFEHIRMRLERAERDWHIALVAADGSAPFVFTAVPGYRGR